MSRKFKTTYYEADNGDAYKMRVRTDWTAVWSDADSEVPTNIKQTHVRISKSKREYGIRPRYAVLSIKDTAGTAPNDVVKIRYLKVPVQTTTAATLLTSGKKVKGGSPEEEWTVERIENELLT